MEDSSPKPPAANSVGILSPSKVCFDEAIDSLKVLEMPRLMQTNCETKVPLKHPTIDSFQSTSSQKHNEGLGSPVSIPCSSIPVPPMGCGVEVRDTEVNRKNASPCQDKTYSGSGYVENPYNDNRVLETSLQERLKSAGSPTKPFKTDPRPNGGAHFTDPNQDGKSASSSLGNGSPDYLLSSSNNNKGNRCCCCSRESCLPHCRDAIINRLCSNSRDVPYWFTLGMIGVLSAFFFYLPWSANLLHILFIVLAAVIGVICGAVYFVSSNYEARLMEREELRRTHTVCQYDNGLYIFPSLKVLPGTGIWSVNYCTNAHECPQSGSSEERSERMVANSSGNYIPPPPPVLPLHFQLRSDHSRALSRKTEPGVRCGSAQEIQQADLRHSISERSGDGSDHKRKGCTSEEFATTSVVFYPTHSQFCPTCSGPGEEAAVNHKCAYLGRNTGNLKPKASEHGCFTYYWIRKSCYRQAIPAVELLLLGILLLVSPRFIGELTPLSIISSNSLRERVSLQNADEVQNTFVKSSPQFTELALQYPSASSTPLRSLPTKCFEMRPSVNLAGLSRCIVTQECCQSSSQYRLASIAEIKASSNISNKIRQNEEVLFKVYKLHTEAGVLMDLPVEMATQNDRTASLHTSSEILFGVCLLHAWVFFAFDISFLVELIVGLIHLGTFMSYYPSISNYHLFVSLLWLAIPILCILLVSFRHQLYSKTSRKKINSAMPSKTQNQHMSNRPTLFHLCFRKGNDDEILNTAQQRSLHQGNQTLTLYNTTSDANNLSKKETDEILEEVILRPHSNIVDYSPTSMRECPPSMLSDTLHGEQLLSTRAVVCEIPVSESAPPPISQDISPAFSNASACSVTNKYPPTYAITRVAPNKVNREQQETTPPLISVAKRQEQTYKEPRGLLCFSDPPLANHSEDSFNGYELDVMAFDRGITALPDQQRSAFKTDGTKPCHFPHGTGALVGTGDPTRALFFPQINSISFDSAVLYMVNPRRHLRARFCVSASYQPRRPALNSSVHAKTSGSDRSCLSRVPKKTMQHIKDGTMKVEQQGGARSSPEVSPSLHNDGGLKEPFPVFIGSESSPFASSLVPYGDDCNPFMILDLELVIVEVSAGMAALLGTPPEFLRLRHLPDVLQWLEVDQETSILLTLRELVLASVDDFEAHSCSDPGKTHDRSKGLHCSGGCRTRAGGTGFPHGPVQTAPNRMLLDPTGGHSSTGSAVRRITLRGRFPFHRGSIESDLAVKHGGDKDELNKTLGCNTAKSKTSSKELSTFAVSLDAWLEMSLLGGQSCNKTKESAAGTALLVLRRPLLHAVCDELQVPLALLDPRSGEILFWNDYAERLTQAKGYDILGWPLFSHFFPIPNHSNNVSNERKDIWESLYFPPTGGSSCGVCAPENLKYSNSAATDRDHDTSAQPLDNTKIAGNDFSFPHIGLRGLLRIPTSFSVEGTVTPLRNGSVTIPREIEANSSNHFEPYYLPNGEFIQLLSRQDEVGARESKNQGGMWFQCCLRPLRGVFCDEEADALTNSVPGFSHAQFEEITKSKLSKQPLKGEENELYGISSSRCTAAVGMTEHHECCEETDITSRSRSQLGDKSRNDSIQRIANSHYTLGQPLPSAAELLQRDATVGNVTCCSAPNHYMINVSGKASDRPTTASNTVNGEPKSQFLGQQGPNRTCASKPGTTGGQITSPFCTFLQMLQSLMQEPAPLMLVLEQPVSHCFLQFEQPGSIGVYANDGSECNIPHKLPTSGHVNDRLKPSGAVVASNLLLQFSNDVRASLQHFNENMKSNELVYSYLGSLLPAAASTSPPSYTTKNVQELPSCRTDVVYERENTSEPLSTHDYVKSTDMLRLTSCLKAFTDQILHIADHYEEEVTRASRAHMSSNSFLRNQYYSEREHQYCLMSPPISGRMYFTSARRNPRARPPAEEIYGSANLITTSSLVGVTHRSSSEEADCIDVSNQQYNSIDKGEQQLSRALAPTSSMWPKYPMSELTATSRTPPKPPVNVSRPISDSGPLTALGSHPLALSVSNPSGASEFGDAKYRPPSNFSGFDKQSKGLQDIQKNQETDDEDVLSRSRLRGSCNLSHDGETLIELSSPPCELDKLKQTMPAGNGGGDSTAATGGVSSFGIDEPSGRTVEGRADFFLPTTEGIDKALSFNPNPTSCTAQTDKSDVQPAAWAMLLSRDEATIPTCRIHVPLGEEFCFGRSSTCHVVVSDTFVSSLQFKIKRTLEPVHTKGQNRRQRHVNRVGARKADAHSNQSLKKIIVMLYDCSVNGTYVNVKKIGKGKHCVLHNNALITFRLSTSQFFMGFMFVLTDAQGFPLRNPHINLDRRVNGTGLSTWVSRWKLVQEPFTPSSSFASASCRNAAGDIQALSVDAVSSNRPASSRRLSSPDSSSLSSITHIPEYSHDSMVSDRRRHLNAPQQRSFTSRKKVTHRETIEWKIGEEMLGKGGSAEVYLGINLTNGQLIAVKRVRLPDTLEDRDNSEAKAILQQYRSLKEEIGVLSKAVHPNIVRYYGSSQNSTYFNILLEFVPGGSLRGLLDNFGALSPGVILSYLRQVLQGLMYLHQLDIVHSDIKTANILITEKGKVKLTDFGTAKLLNRPRATFATPTLNFAPRRGDSTNRDASPLPPRSPEGGNGNSGGGITMHISGTLRWMDPNLFHGNSADPGAGPTKASDIWSVGCAMIEMMSGEAPWFEYEFENSEQIVNLLTYTQEPPEIPECAECPDLVRLSQQCLQIDPTKRPTCAELLQMVIASEQRLQTEAMLKDSSGSPPRATPQPISGVGSNDGGSPPSQPLTPLHINPTT